MPIRQPSAEGAAASPREWSSPPRLLAAATGFASLALVIVAGLVGSDDASRNPANYLAWLYFWPGVAILVALVGDLWRHLNPWRRLGSLLLRVDVDQLDSTSLNVWPAAAAFAGFVWFDLASGLSNRPRAVAGGALLLSAFVLLPALGTSASWLARAEPFGLVMRAIGLRSLPSLIRRHRHSIEPDWGWDHFFLCLLPLVAAVFDALIATPQRTNLAGAAGGKAALERAGPVFVIVRSVGLAATSVALAMLALIVAAAIGPRPTLAATACRMVLVALPVAVALMAAHNLPALLQLGPRLPGVLGAFLAGASIGAGTAPDTPLAVTPSSPLWMAEIAIVLIGFLWSACLAWRDLEGPDASGLDRVAAAYPGWVFVLVTAMAALLILFQPVSALAAR